VVASTTVSYYLPATRAWLRANLDRTHDEVLNSDHDMVSGASLGLVTVADLDRPRMLTVESGAWRDYAFSVSLAEDGRLVGADVESTGQLGTVLAGAATVGVGALALATGTFPLVAALGAGALAGGRPGGGPKVAELPPPATSAGPADSVALAYRAAHPEPATRLADLTRERRSTLARVDELRAAYLAAAGDDKTRYGARAAYEAARRVLADVETELDAAKTHFAAWRATTISTNRAVRDVVVPLEALPTVDGTSLTFVAGADGQRVREFFDKVGQVLARPTTGTAAAPPSAQRADEVTALQVTAAFHVLRPRLMELVEASGHEPSAVALGQVHRQLVVDRGCDELTVTVRRSWNARRRTEVTLGALGALTGVTFNGSASAVAGVATAQQALQGVGGSLASAVTTRASIDHLASAGQDAELARLKNLVAIGEQRVLAAGQAATVADYAHLARLRQQIEETQLQRKLPADRPEAGQ